MDYDNYFKCPRCGYVNDTNEYKHHCPVCGMDCNLYLEDFIALAIIALYFISWILSMFNIIPYSIFFGLFIIMIPTCIILFVRSLDRNGYIRDGFITPNSPSDIINDTIKHIEYKKYRYLDGTLDKDFVTDIAVANTDDGITLYSNNIYSNLNKKYNLTFENIDKIELVTEKVLAKNKCFFTTAVMSLLAGPIAGVASGLCNSQKDKKYLYINGIYEGENIVLYLDGNSADSFYNKYLANRKLKKLQKIIEQN